MTSTPRREPGDEVIDWIASGQRSYRSVLRALGQLFVALAAGDAEPDEPERRAGALQPRSFGLRRQPPQEESRVAEDRPAEARRDPFRAPQLPPDATDDDIQLLLTDARARAHELIDDSVAQAQALLVERSGGDAGQQALERIRATVATVADEVRAIHRRLDAIEALLRPAAPGVQARPAAPTAPASTVEPEPPPAPPRPAAPAPEPVVRAAPLPADSPAAGFSPDGGAVLLRVSPVPGFAGLMRLQDALVRVIGVSEAGVESYSQGEARLRIQLSAPIVPEELTRTLAEHLGQQTRMESASAAERSMQVTLI